MRFIMSLGKASCMVYSESQLLLRKGSKICSNLVRFIVFRETKCDDRVMRCAQWCGSGQTSIPGVRRGWPSSHVTWTRLTVPTALTASASCDSVSFAQFCLLSHRSRAMCPTLLSLLSLGESRKTRLERVMVEIRRSSHHWLGSLHEGAKIVGAIGQAISDVLFLLGFCASLRTWAAVGESFPSLISLLSSAVVADADDTGGWGENLVSTVRAACPVEPRSSYWPWYSSSLSPEVSSGLTLDLKAHYEVWELGARPSEYHFNHEMGVRGCSPQTLHYKLAHCISSWPLTTGSAGSPLNLTPGKSLLLRQGHLDLVTQVM